MQILKDHPVMICDLWGMRSIEMDKFLMTTELIVLVTASGLNGILRASEKILYQNRSQKNTRKKS